MPQDKSGNFWVSTAMTNLTKHLIVLALILLIAGCDDQQVKFPTSDCTVTDLHRSGERDVMVLIGKVLTPRHITTELYSVECRRQEWVDQ